MGPGDMGFGVFAAGGIEIGSLMFYRQKIMQYGMPDSTEPK